MNQVNVKIHRYDEATNTLYVSFSSDESSKSIDEYQVVAFQPHNMQAESVEELLKTIATVGISTAQSQDKKESMLANVTLLNSLKTLESQTLTYNVDDLIPPSTPIQALNDNLTDVVNS
jgi:hypothetical protein